MADYRLPSSTTVTVKFPGHNLTLQSIRAAKVVTAPGAHDIMTVTTNTPEKHTELMAGSPVVVTWGSRRAGIGVFRGYLYRADPTYSDRPETSTFIFIGVSFPLMDKGTEVWAGVRASDVVRDIAFQHGLASDVEDHPRVYGQVMQAGDSYWSVLNRLADETGYVLRMEGATLVFRSRQSLTKHLRPLATLVDLSTLAGQDRAAFAPRIGTYNPELGATPAFRPASGIDPSTGVALQHSAINTPLQGSPLLQFTEPQVGKVVNTEVEALTASVAAQEANRFTKVAVLDVAGDPALVPERFIYLRGAPDEFSGYWVIRSATHEVDVSAYRCRLVVGLDSLGPPLYDTGDSPTTAATRRSVNPHRPGALDWSNNTPVLSTNTHVKGSAGTPLNDFVWTSQVSRRT